MIAALTVLHILVSIFLVAVVLLQRGKGAEIGAVFGGGASSTVFGSRGAGNFLTKMTAGCAVVFMLTSMSLSYLHTQSVGERLFDEGAIEEPAEEDDSPFADLGSVPAEETGGTTPLPPPGAEAPGAEAEPPAAGAEPPAEPPVEIP